MINAYHEEILKLIKQHSGTPTQHTFLDSYLGTTHPRYPISNPALRAIARAWMKNHRTLSAKEFSELITTLIKAPSSTEKIMAGMMMDYATSDQQKFNPKLFDSWLNHLLGWAEVDAVCTGKYGHHQLIENWERWSVLLGRFSKSKNIHKRRASLVFLCSAVRHSNDKVLADMAFANIKRLQHEKEILITKAISWLLRSMIKNHKKSVADFIKEHKGSLPAIAVRETLTVLKTGTKTKRKE